MADGADRAFEFHDAQIAAQQVCAGPATHIMLEGGSGSGKSVQHARNVLTRAIKAPDSRHAIFRFRFNHCKQSIGLATMPEVAAMAFPELGPLDQYLDRTDWYWKLPNRSEIWIGGLDDKDRTEKMLGFEYVTMWLNECSQITWEARELAKTRLRQLVNQVLQGQPPKPLRPRMLYDQNPPPKSHWTWKLFHQKVDPETKLALPDPGNYAFYKLNPEDNAQHLAPGYLDSLRNASPRWRKRFFEGDYADDNPYALFSETFIDRWRHLGGDLPDFQRVVVGVDPSGAGDTDNADNDEIGITVGALGTDGHAYLLEDCTIKAGPATWGNVVGSAFDRHAADCVAAEKNFGGEMVRQTILTARPKTLVKLVNASRGKVVRAEPFSSLYEKGRVHHVGYFRQLEDELCAFSTRGYLGQSSPNRADAWIWVLAELFPGMVRDMETKKSEPQVISVAGGRGFWRSN